MSEKCQNLPGAAATKCSLFDHLVSAGEYTWRNRKTKRLCRVEVDREFKLRRLLHRQITRLGSLQYLVDEHRSAATHRNLVGSVRQERAGLEGLFRPDAQRQRRSTVIFAMFARCW